MLLAAWRATPCVQEESVIVSDLNATCRRSRRARGQAGSGRRSTCSQLVGPGRPSWRVATACGDMATARDGARPQRSAPRAGRVVGWWPLSEASKAPRPAHPRVVFYLRTGPTSVRCFLSVSTTSPPISTSAARLISIPWLLFPHNLCDAKILSGPFLRTNPPCLSA